MITTKYIFLLAAIFFFAKTTIAQTNTKVSGTVTDKISSIEFATVVVYSSSDSLKGIRGIQKEKTIKNKQNRQKIIYSKQ